MLRAGEDDREELLNELMRVEDAVNEGVERYADEISVVCTRSSGRAGSMRGVSGDSTWSRRRKATSMVACMAAMLRRRLSASDCAGRVDADIVDADIVDDGDLAMRRTEVACKRELAKESVVLSERRRRC